ncbi:MAG: hypothetical protein HZB25_03405 [Candidatus Eisenbacteria bacterium]|nr:hypothetical protein [Candidatus Eisenbacteria bacterium]
MRRFLARLLLFSVPLMASGVAMVLVDPYNFLGVSHLVPDEVKARTSAKLNYPLWEMLRFRRRPKADILLGDSRMMTLKPEAIRAAGGADCYNFAYGGGSVPEIMSTFWFADSVTRLRSVVVGVNFNMYNARARHDRTADYRELTENPCLYFVNRTVVRAAFTCVRAMVTGRVPQIERPPMNHEQFWAYQLKVTAADSYRHYAYPVEFREGLRGMADRCRERGIRLTFIVFPTHADLQSRVADFGLLREQERFRADLRSIATTHDFDVPGALTRERANFEDPYHFREPVMRRIVREVWGTSGIEEPAPVRR